MHQTDSNDNSDVDAKSLNQIQDELTNIKHNLQRKISIISADSTCKSPRPPSSSVAHKNQSPRHKTISTTSHRSPRDSISSNAFSDIENSTAFHNTANQDAHLHSTRVYHAPLKTSLENAISPIHGESKELCMIKMLQQMINQLQNVCNLMSILQQCLCAFYVSYRI